MNDDAFHQDPRNPEAAPPPSKSRRKRDATAIQELGAQLVKLTLVQLNRVPLPEDLLAAVRAAQAMPQRGAHQRQLQYIGKLMRRLDEVETAAIRAALAAARSPRR